MLQIIQADIADIPLIHLLGERCFLPTYLPFISKEQVYYMFDMMYGEASLAVQMQEKKHLFLLAREGVDFLGFASFQYNVDDVPSAKLHKLYVLPDAQVSGIGRQLLDEAEAMAASEGQKAMRLNVNRYNKALGFYQHLGYVIDKEVDINIGEGYFMNDYEMVKSLSPTQGNK